MWGDLIVRNRHYRFHYFQQARQSRENYFGERGDCIVNRFSNGNSVQMCKAIYSKKSTLLLLFPFSSNKVIQKRKNCFCAEWRENSLLVDFPIPRDPNVARIWRFRWVRNRHYFHSLTSKVIQKRKNCLCAEWRENSLLIDFPIPRDPNEQGDLDE